KTSPIALLLEQSDRGVCACADRRGTRPLSPHADSPAQASCKCGPSKFALRRRSANGNFLPCWLACCLGGTRPPSSHIANGWTIRSKPLAGDKPQTPGVIASPTRACAEERVARHLIEAEFALNEGGGVMMRGGKAFRNGIQTSEKFCHE